MAKLLFIDTEVTMDGKIKDIGAIKLDKSIFRSDDVSKLEKYAKGCDFVVGHNILKHDSKYIGKYLWKKGFEYIDTLYLSPLLFPKKPYHNLVKDDKLITDQLNNPVNDSQKCKVLFDEECAKFEELDKKLKGIYGELLSSTQEFRGFFSYVKWDKNNLRLPDEIVSYFEGKICKNTKSLIASYIGNNPIELAYALAIINVNDRESLTPAWVHINYPFIEEIIHNLCANPCNMCDYCVGKFNAKKRLKEIFNYDVFREYDGEPLQEKAVTAAIRGESLLAVFPTGGGKSLTFQLPALILGEAEKSLTVVISPLQSLMKDQVDNLLNRGFIDAVTINGMLNPIERAEAIESLSSGKASILYIAPESLRSKTIERVLLSRTIARFVIDEAHCFSAWGQDFRVDYLYIGKFIKKICQAKGIDKIPVSCFTATAKQKVISDINDYFKEYLGVSLSLYTTTSNRKNLHYTVKPMESQEKKYSELRRILEDKKGIPTIIYASTTFMCEDLARKLTNDGFPALFYHGKMERQDKIENQNKFKDNECKIIVATSAFGMGVDKSDVGVVIHYEISNSLENYVQEAGRAGRDENLEAECYILFCEDDLDKHFMMLNQTKLNMNEIQQIWTAIKNLTKNKKTIDISALELARYAGWNEEKVNDIEVRVRTAISALENAKYIERGMNSPRVFANGLLANNIDQARQAMEKSSLFSEEDMNICARIMTYLISRKNITKGNKEEAESRVDYIADKLGLNKSVVIRLINLMRECNIIADSFDMAATINKDSNNKTLTIFNNFIQLEKFLIDNIYDEQKIVDLKQLNDLALKEGIKKASVKNIKILLSYWMLKEYIVKTIPSEREYKIEPLYNKNQMINRFEKRQEVAQFVIKHLYDKAENNKDGEIVQFSLLELKKCFSEDSLFSISNSLNVKQEDIEEALLYLSRISAMTIEGGFLVTYNSLQISRLITDNNIKYKKADYKELDDFYKMKIQQIHIVGEYANMMVNNYKQGLEFVSDYFNLEYDGFIKKYFKGDRKGEIQRNITPSKYRLLFGELSTIQKRIIDDENRYIAVLAGPGSGKTRVLVHKLASLLLLEDIKSEQLLMLTFSRYAANEFKSRLLDLIKTPAYYVDIKTFHSYCFDLLGKIGDETEFDKVIDMALEMIENGEVEPNRITKSVIVVDEAQDMDIKEYRLINALIERNEDIRVILVGDDDQNIYEFRGSDSTHLLDYINKYNVMRYEMLENYRSSKEIVDFTNSYINKNRGRLKKNIILSKKEESGFSAIYRYSSLNMEENIVNSVKAQYQDCNSIAILTETNEDALKILGLCLKNDIPSRLIQSDDGFNLSNIYEISTFIKLIMNLGESPIILKEAWDEKVKEINTMFKDSTVLPLFNSIIQEFEKVNKDYYKTDFIEYVKESKIEDFTYDKSKKVIISTIHKAKGKEYEMVHVMLKQNALLNDKVIRRDYVGFTRAKNKLFVHINNDSLEQFKNDVIEYRRNDNAYYEPEELCYQLSHKDVVLGKFKANQAILEKCMAGQELKMDKDCYLSLDNKEIIKFSESFSNTIKPMLENGYKFDYSNIRFVVNWFDKEDEKEYLIILPDIYLKKDKEYDKAKREEMINNIYNKDIIGGKTIVDFVSSTQNIFKEIKERNRMSFIFKTVLINIICGIESKFVVDNHFDELTNYGFIDSIYKKRVQLIIKVLIDYGIISDTDEKVSLNDMDVTDDIYLSIMRNF